MKAETLANILVEENSRLETMWLVQLDGDEEPGAVFAVRMLIDSNAALIHHLNMIEDES